MNTVANWYSLAKAIYVILVSFHIIVKSAEKDSETQKTREAAIYAVVMSC